MIDDSAYKYLHFASKLASKAKAVLKKSNCNVASDAFDGLNGVIYWYLEQAAKRAKANGRKTVRTHDFTV